ncbi:unnamed protein product (macronuclear) [Paramecium tetraurelia]|uniref:Diacylglycerol kinase n=1 Tax=Paramecium tetraurelia TaxID=5888 RepID=A0C4F9_PARTE|nr:uncharacterized protein GSPATT00035156001 [Paramecium tetraurelia]CAK65676.1 unnamed protein product [Paramecium tetraurelia]|eukprot:XP_001433073.1 hypothetical protein (macronuclear) [Paramecium tetraurelia strain d4-2]
MEYTYYLFYNSGSGGNRGQQFLQLDQKELSFNIKDSHCRVKFYNICDSKSREVGLQQIMKQKQENIHVVMAGGDGSIMWIVELLLQHQVSIHSCIIIPFPFGTGNDFANTLGWGTTVPNDVIGMDSIVLKGFVEEWMEGVESYFDVWDVDIRLQQGGYISEIKRNENGVGEMKLQLKDQRYYKQMINYFSIGVDARIGFGFDKNRTSNQCCNKCVYCWEGFKKMFLKTPKVNQSIENIHNLNDDDLLESGLIQKSKDEIVVPGNPVNLLCLNINSYAGGLKNIWLNAQQNQVKSYSNIPSVSDGLLEILSFNSILGLGSERLIPGQATRLSQSKGPLKLNFKQNELLRTYFQIDGQYFSITNPSSVLIRSCQSLPQGKIRVLINKKGLLK